MFMLYILSLIRVIYFDKVFHLLYALPLLILITISLQTLSAVAQFYTAILDRSAVTHPFLVGERSPILSEYVTVEPHIPLVSLELFFV